MTYNHHEIRKLQLKEAERKRRETLDRLIKEQVEDDRKNQFDTFRYEDWMDEHIRQKF